MCEEDTQRLNSLEPLVRHLEARVNDLETQETTHAHGPVESWYDSPGIGLPAAPHLVPSLPLVLDPGLARTTPCIRIELGEDTPPLVFSRGIVGALGEEEQAAYCQEGYLSHAATPEELARLRALPDAARQCSADVPVPVGYQEHVDSYLTCLERELAAKA